VILDEIGGRKFAIPFREFRFVVEQLQMARRAGLKEKDDALGLAGKMRLLGRERIRQCRRRRPTALAEQRAQRYRAEANAALLEEPAARDELRVESAIEMRLAIHGVMAL